MTNTEKSVHSLANALGITLQPTGISLTQAEIEILESAYTILATHRLCADFNGTHDLTIPDALQVIDEVIAYSNNSED